MKERLVLFSLAIAVLAGAAPGSAQEERIFLGSYTADKLNDTGPLQAVFTSTGSREGVRTWSVVFTVTMDTAEYEYSGSAEGSLSRGRLSGQVQSETGEQTFTFRGEHDGGKLHATHAEITDLFEQPTGDMVLEEATVLRGTYELPDEDGLEPVRALFTPRPTGAEPAEPSWNVIFDFRFGNLEYSFSGTAAGSLSEGPLSGTVKNATGERTFVFRGEHRDGKYRASHAEITSGAEEATGTMTLGG